MFYENHLTSGFHTNTVISQRRVCLPIKMASKTVIRSIASKDSHKSGADFLRKTIAPITSAKDQWKSSSGRQQGRTFMAAGLKSTATGFVSQSRPEFNLSAVLVNNQLFCLLPAGIFNHVMLTYVQFNVKSNARPH